MGHGGYGAIVQKEVQMKHFASIGIDASIVDPLAFIIAVGWMEIALGVAVLIRPLYSLLAFVLAWKLFTEFLFPMSGTPIFEWIERSGAYAAPLVLIFVQRFYPPTGAVIWNLFRGKRSSLAEEGHSRSTYG